MEILSWVESDNGKTNFFEILEEMTLGKIQESKNILAVN